MENFGIELICGLISTTIGYILGVSIGYKKGRADKINNKS